MLSKPIRVALFLLVAVSLFWGFSAMEAQATYPASLPVRGAGARVSTNFIYIQPVDPSGALLLSSWLDPDGSDFDQYVWDNFTLPSNETITEIDWVGGFDPTRLGRGGPVIDFTVAIYPSNVAGTEPAVAGPPLVEYQTGGDAGQTAIGPVGTIPMYAYAFSLPAPFAATAGVKYWVQIEAWQQGSQPDWGFAAGTGGDSNHYVRDVGAGGDIRYHFATRDAAFSLLGPDVPISDLSAANDSPTELGQVTTFTATVSAGSGISYDWDFGDQTTDSGQIVMHVYGVTGIYTAVVTATNAISSATAATYVTITEVPPITGLTAVNSSPTRLTDATTFTATISAGGNPTYSWNFGDGQTAIGATAVHTYTAAASYTAIVTATNGAGSATASTVVTITNQAPVANAGLDQSALVNATVTLDGSGSTDPDAHWPLTYGWTQFGGPAVVLSSAVISRPTFTAPAQPTIITFTLSVTDTFGLSSEPDLVQVEVIPGQQVYLPLLMR